MGYDDRYDPDVDFDRWFTLGTARAIAPWVRSGESVLELGCATGLMTAELVAAGAVVVGVERSEAYLRRAEERGLEGTSFVCGDATETRLGRTFDHVVAANLLHEVDRPAEVMDTIRVHLRPGGLVHLTVPNPRSLHRLVGIEMGLLADTTALSGRASSLETLHTIDADELERLGAGIGLRAVQRGGVMVKPLPNAVMATLPDELVEGLLAAARHLPELCAMSYVTFR
jgi:SAM-dependent methyltransferase